VITLRIVIWSRWPPPFPPPVRSYLFLALLISASCFAISSFASNQATPQKAYEKPYALIFGTVWGPDARPVYGIRIRIRRANQKKPKWEVFSNHAGEFAQRVPPGNADYVVWADLKGYKWPDHNKLLPGPEVKVHIDNDERADIGVHLIR
jgi:hypothetical protein